jgi:hypothetical protein
LTELTSRSDIAVVGLDHGWVNAMDTDLCRSADGVSSVRRFVGSSVRPRPPARFDPDLR